MFLLCLCLSHAHNSKIRIKPVSEHYRGSFKLIPLVQKQNDTGSIGLHTSKRQVRVLKLMMLQMQGWRGSARRVQGGGG